MRVCRQALPALNPDGRVTVNKVASGETSDAIRIEYEVTRAGRPVLERFALCRFAGEGFAAHKADLIGLVTESGPLSGAALFLLKRHYLETPDAVAGDPGMGRAVAAVPETTPALAYGVQQALVALPKAGIYALLAASYALVFGLAGQR